MNCNNRQAHDPRTLRPTPCMKDGQCTKHYPREFLRETITSLNGYPLYRRRSPEDGGVETTIGRFHVDNRWVVPYSPFLSRTFDCHVNVEYCRSICALKYLMAYLNKGKDKAVVGLANQHRNDEILRYQIARYISTNEGFWRMLQFPIHDHFPAVEQLQVHLENGQRTLFNVENAPDRAAEPPATTLTGFFQLCASDDFAKTLLYIDVPRYYRWVKKKWQRRIQGHLVPETDGIRKSTTLGRIYTIHPKNTECYLLRLLLLHVRGPTSFADLRTVDGTVFETYAEACRERGLLADDQHCTHGSHARSPIVLTKFATCLPSCFTCAKFPILFVYGNNTKKRWPQISSELFADAQTTTRYRTLTQFSTELYFASRTSSFRFLEENLLAIIICPVLIALLNKTTAFLEKLLLNTPITTLKCRNDSQETNSHSPKSKDTFTKNYLPTPLEVPTILSFSSMRQEEQEKPIYSIFS